MKNKKYFEYRGLHTKDFDFWRYGKDLGKKLDDIEVNAIKSHIPKNSKCIVDLGCGTGYHINELSNLELADRYVGVDFSSTYLEKANALCTVSKNVEFRLGKVQNLCNTLDEDFADVFLLIGILQYLEPSELEELSSSLLKISKKNCSIIIKHPVYYGQQEKTITTQREGFSYTSSYKRFEDIALPFLKNFDFRCMHRIFNKEEFTDEEYSTLDSIKMSQQNIIVFDRNNSQN